MFYIDVEEVFLFSQKRGIITNSNKGKLKTNSIAVYGAFKGAVKIGDILNTVGEIEYIYEVIGFTMIRRTNYKPDYVDILIRPCFKLVALEINKINELLLNKRLMLLD